MVPVGNQRSLHTWPKHRVNAHEKQSFGSVNARVFLEGLTQARARWQSRRVGCHRRSSSNHHQHTRTVDLGEPSRLVLRSPSPLTPSTNPAENSSNNGNAQRPAKSHTQPVLPPFAISRNHEPAAEGDGTPSHVVKVARRKRVRANMVTSFLNTVYEN
ncbi:hypothetical protein MRX96_012264 [Rhipicephalus microplus]